jgi:hypothetical protein
MPRTQQLSNYFDKLKTTGLKIDFLSGMIIAQDEIDDEEKVFIKNKTVELFNPPKQNQNMNENGNLPFDEVKAQEICDRYAKMLVESQINLGKKYKQILDGLVEDDDLFDLENSDNKEEIAKKEIQAAFLAKNTPEAIKYQALKEVYDTLIDNSIVSSESSLKNMEILDNALKKAKDNAFLLMTPEEKKIAEIGFDLSTDSPNILAGKNPLFYNVFDGELQHNKDFSKTIVRESADLNWKDDNTINNYPKIINQQLRSDHYERSRQYFLGLKEDKDKVNFLINGMIDDKLKIDGKDVNCYTNKEKVLFKKCFTNFFRPLTADGKFDHDLFSKRMKTLADEVGELDKKYVQNVISTSKNNDLLTGMDQNAKAQLQRTDPNYIKAQLIREFMAEAFANEKLIRPEIKNQYIKVKSDPNDKNGPKDIMTIFNAEIMKSGLEGVTNPSVVANFGNCLTKVDNSKFKFSEEEEKKISEDEKKTKTQIASDVNKFKDKWLKPDDRHLTMDNLKKLNNLYYQVVDADHWYHKDSDKFKQFKRALEEAHNLYEEMSEDEDDIDDEDLERIYEAKISHLNENILASSYHYLDDKTFKARGTDLGQERYEIAFAALSLTNVGLFNYMARNSNITHEASNTKKVSFDDMQARAKRSIEDHRVYMKNRNKEEEKNKINEKMQKPIKI